MAAVCAIVVLIALFWERISDSFGPMQQDESQCLVCQRNRVEKWVCEKKVSDSISSNQYSNWIDSFVPTSHSHVWLVHTDYYRGHWFGPKSIGCGGVSVIPQIFEQRNTLGEQEARQLVAKWHELVTSPTFSNSLKEMDEFMNAVVRNPESLLEVDSE